MTDIWRIFVIEGEENLNRNITTTLRKDGYTVQGAMSGAEAIRNLWSEEYNVVICDLDTPGVDGLDLLQWLRWYRPNMHILLVGGSNTTNIRVQALESGAAGYLEKPLDLRLLKEELRRFLQWTGFSASLDSFDLLDVVQIITMSRRSIALLVNTGLEERGMLRFQNGELAWAEYGTLLGEEAFFALAAHKNGTVVHQPWSGQNVSNVTQPLSRLILQALQYRTKYANMQQASGELNALTMLRSQPNGNQSSPPSEELDDSPFVVLTEYQETRQSEPIRGSVQQEPSPTRGAKEWWEKTGSIPVLPPNSGSGGLIPSRIDAAPTFVFDGPILSGGLGGTTVPSPTQPVPNDLPAWLTEQPTSPEMAAIRRSSPADSEQIPTTPVVETSSPLWPPYSPTTTGEITPNQTPSFSTGAEVRQMPPTEWLPVKPASRPQPLQGLQNPSPAVASSGNRSPQAGMQLSGPHQRIEKRSYNYAALVAALQTLGYSIVGFIAAAVVDMEGQPIAQVAVDDLDISSLCRLFSTVLKSVLSALDQGIWGIHEETIVTSANRRILIRLVDSEKKAFQILITTRDADPAESLRFMVNVSGTLSAALHEPGEKTI